MEALQAGRSALTGAYDLMKVNGRVLPAPVDETGVREAEPIRCRIMSGELRLDADGSYHHALTARYDASGASYTRVLESDGTWRFVSSVLDETSGEVALLSANGCTSTAAVTRISLVQRDPSGSTWVYLRR
jgi:hypothetical protein